MTRDNWIMVKPLECSCVTWWQRECCENNCDPVASEADRFLLRSWLLCGLLILAACVLLFYAGGLLGSD